MKNKFLPPLSIFLLLSQFLTAQTYCPSKSATSWELWVSNVQFGTINNPSTQFKDYATLGYSDYTNLLATVQKGQNYPLSMSAGLSWSGNLPNVYSRVWIDFNKNNVFEDSEKILEQSNTNPLTTNVLIPNSATVGNTRMRVAMKWGAYPTPCETFNRGEVEDYSVQITEGVQTNLPDLILSNLSLINPSLEQGNVLNYKVDIKNIGLSIVGSTFRTEAYLSTDTILSINDVLIDSFTNNYLSLSNAGIQTESVANIPTTLAVGQYYLIMKTDVRNQIEEINENNNSITSNTPLSIAALNSGTGCGFAKMYGFNPKRSSSRIWQKTETTPTGGFKLSKYYSHYINLLSVLVTTLSELTLDASGNQISFVHDTFRSPPFDLSTLKLAFDRNFLSTSMLKDSSFVLTKLSRNNTVLFSKTINLIPNQRPYSAVRVDEIVEFSDHFMVLGRTSYQETPNTQPFVATFMIKLDLNGEKMGQNINPGIRDINISYKLHRGQSGSYYYVTQIPSYEMLVKTDNNGAFQWIKSVRSDFPSTALVSVHESSDASAVFVTRNDNGQSYTTKLNGTTGNVDWEVNLGRKVVSPNSSPNPNAQTYSTASTNDGGFITGFSSNNWGGRFIYARFDANGNFLWYKQNREYQNIRGGALALSDGSFVFTNFGDSTWSVLKTTANSRKIRSPRASS